MAAGAARSAGVAYVDLAVGDTKALVSGISDAVRQAASDAQKSLSSAFNLSGASDSFKGIVSDAEDAAKAAGDAISTSLTDSAKSAATAVGDSITTTVSDAASAAADALTATMGEAGRQAGEQLALDFESAAKDVQLGLFSDEELVTQAGDAGRQAGDALKQGLDESTASLGSAFGMAGLQASLDDAKNAIKGALTQGTSEGTSESSSIFEEFKQGLVYSVGTWSIGMAIGSAITNGVTKALDFVKSSVIDFNSEMQSAQISYGTLLGSDQAGSQMISQIKKFSLSTPFQFEDLVTGSQKLLALGISAKNVIPDLKALGDATSALGGDGAHMNELVQIFGEMQAKGQIMEAQVRELQIRGVPALQILANEYGVSTSKMQEMIKKGQVMASDALPKLVQGIEQGTKSTQAMGNEMQRQSATFKGSMSNLKDGVTQFSAGAFKPVFDSINRVTARLAQFASGGKLDSFVTPIASAVGKGISDVGRFVKSLVDDLKPAKPLIKDLTDGFGKFSLTRAALSGLGDVILGIAKAIGVIGQNRTAAAVISSIVLGLVAFRSVGTAFSIAQTAITGLIPAVKGLAASMLGLDAAEDSNVILLIVQGVIAAGVAVYELYQHSKLFRDIIADIGSVFVTVWHGVEAGYSAIASFLKGIFDSAPVQGAISVLGDIFKTTASVVMTAVRAIGSVLDWLWHNVFEPFVQGVAFAAKLFFTVMMTLILTPALIVYQLLEPIVMALWHNVFEPAFKGIGNVAVWLYKNALQPVFSWIGSLFTGGLSATVMWLWRNVFSPAFQGIGSVAQWLWRNAIAPFVAGMKLEFTALSIVALWLWHTIFEPALKGIGTVATWLYQNVLKPFGSLVVSLFKDDIGPAATWLWDSIFQPVFSAIGTAAKWLYDNFIKPEFDLFVAALKSAGQVAEWLYDNAIKPFFSAIGSVVGNVLSGIKSGFDTAVSGIKTVWSGLIDILNKPVSFLVNTVYTNGIEEVWNFIASKVGIPKLPDAHYAQGGIIGGPRSAGDWIPIYATAGEGVLTTDEIAALGGPAGFENFRAGLSGRRNQKSSTNGQGHFDIGGIVGNIWDGIKSAGSAVSHGLGDLTSFAKRIVVGGLKGVANDMLNPVLGELGNMMPGSSTLKSLLMGVPKTLIKDALDFFGKKDATAVPNGPATSAQVLQWIQQAMSAAGVSGADWVNGLETIVANESGGNPRAINNWDSNAAAGDPSRGLMQTIGSTFEAYRLSSLPDDIYNPVANIVAGIRYILSRYGSIGSVPGIKSMANGGSYVGYAKGTDGAARGWAWVGEKGPELVHFGGGETVLTHQQSQKAMVTGRVGGYSGGTLGGAYGRITADQSWVNGIKDKINQLTLESLNAMSKSQRKAIEAEKKVYELRLRSAETSLSQAKSAYNGALRANRTYYDANYKIDSAGGKLTGTTSQIKSATDSLNKLILSMDANSAGMDVIHQDNVRASRLESLSTQRAAIEKEIAAATKAATTIATKAADYASLSGLHLSSISGAGDIINGLKSNDSQLQTFIRDMNRVKRLGFSSTVIQQIADMGPSSGAAYAEALASASGGQVKQVNSLLKQVSNTTTAYGRNVASDIYDTGRDAGRGFLSGLKSQEAAITSEMTRIAGSMVDAIKRFLGIRSPSRLMHEEVGLMVGAGLVSGMDASIDDVGSAAERLGVAASSVAVRAPRMAYAGNGTGADGVPVVHVYIDGKEVIDKRVQVQIEENNNALYRALHGGRI